MKYFSTLLICFALVTFSPGQSFSMEDEDQDLMEEPIEKPKVVEKKIEKKKKMTKKKQRHKRKLAKKRKKQRQKAKKVN